MRPDAQAVSCSDFSLGYRELEAAVDLYAGAISNSGVRRGDVVAVFGNSRPECFVVFLAACRIGALYLGLNPKHTLGELASAAGDSRPRILFGMLGPQEPEQDEKLRSLIAGISSIELVVTRAGQQGSRSLPLDEFLHTNGGSQQRSAALQPGPDDPCAIVYTSGSTGSPKGALLSQRGMIRSCLLNWRHWYGASPDLRTVAQHPIDHVGWLVCECATTLVAGGSLFFRERFDGGETLQLIERERLNLWIAFPSMVMLALQSPEFHTRDISSLRRVAFGSLPSLDLLRRLRTRSEAVFSVSYGVTEASGGALTATEEGADLEQVATSLGRPLPGVELLIVEPDGRTAPGDNPGELLVRDDSLFLGYLNHPEATATTLDSEGWLHTGDAVAEQPDGTLRMVGRLKEMFKSGGYSVYPTEVEVALSSHEGLGAVAVVEAPDPLWGEVGIAFIQPKPGVRVREEDLRTHAHAHLANYKVPKHFIILDAIPQLANGKSDKVRLRSEARQLVEVRSQSAEKRSD